MSANVAIKYAECCNLNRLNVKLKQIYNVSFPCLWLKGERIASRVSYYLDVKLSESERRGVVGECVFALVFGTKRNPLVVLRCGCRGVNKD